MMIILITSISSINILFTCFHNIQVLLFKYFASLEIEKHTQIKKNKRRKARLKSLDNEVGVQYVL